jgi:hypothetical protein
MHSTATRRIIHNTRARAHDEARHSAPMHGAAQTACQALELVERLLTSHKILIQQNARLRALYPAGGGPPRARGAPSRYSAVC